MDQTQDGRARNGQREAGLLTAVRPEPGSPDGTKQELRKNEPKNRETRNAPVDRQMAEELAVRKQTAARTAVDQDVSDRETGDESPVGTAAGEGPGAAADTDQQIANVLYQAAKGRRVRDICDQAGISIATFYRWRDKYDGLSAAGVERLHRVEEENRQLLKRIERLRFEKVMLEVELTRQR